MPDSTANRKAPRCQGTRILLVDDDPATVEALQGLLGLEGAFVTAATSGRDAVHLAANGDYDIVITDLGMAGMDGYELLRRLKAMPSSSAWPVIALTGVGGGHGLAAIQSAGFSAHLVKPAAIEDLLSLIDRQVAEARDDDSVKGA